MIAQYQRKFGFTAIMVSHEIPDVYFISTAFSPSMIERLFFKALRRSLKISTTRSKMKSSTVSRGYRKN